MSDFAEQNRILEEQNKSLSEIVFGQEELIKSLQYRNETLEEAFQKAKAAATKKDDGQDGRMRTIKQNEKIIKEAHKKKMQRHVQVDNEKVFDDFLESFHMDYAKEVVSASAIEILKMVQDES